MESISNRGLRGLFLNLPLLFRAENRVPLRASLLHGERLGSS